MDTQLELKKEPRALPRIGRRTVAVACAVLLIAAAVVLNLILFGGSAVISLVILLRNRREIRSYQKTEWMDRRCLKCLFTSAGFVALALLMCTNMVILFLV